MTSKKRAVLLAELERVSREEARLNKSGENGASKWSDALKEKIPPKAQSELEKLFAKAFEMIFNKGTPLIEKSIQREELEMDFQVNDFAVDLKRSRRALLKLDAAAVKGELAALAAGTVEGVGLGALGIGLPDIVLFVALILRGAYETALRYGFDYESAEERLFILILLEGAMRRGEDRRACGARADALFAAAPERADETALKAQLKRTSDAFAADMLLAKFIQGLPVAGIVGGLANPVYYSRVTGYVRLKYKKRYLMKKLAEGE